MKEQVYINKTSEVYDAIVIGSGISGGQQKNFVNVVIKL
jgi:hypothetical protein